MTNSKEKILKGIVNNLINKITGYPTTIIFHDFELNKKYKIDLLSYEVSPHISQCETNENYLRNLYKWFDNELNTRKLDVKDILKCEVEIYIYRKKFLFFGYNIYNFSVNVKTENGEYKKEHKVKGNL